MFEEQFLYQKLAALCEFGAIKQLPKFVESNLKFELRPYQRAALENFIAYFDGNLRQRPTQVLFHMATGSGKTLLMAALMVYLYRQGYRNFLFTAHLQTILDKTRDNFIEPAARKYLFADELNIDGKRIAIRSVENFNDSVDGAINIHFSTIQKLGVLFDEARENAMTFDDFRAYKLVLISDEAHHLNADKKSKKQSDERHSWESTVKNIFEPNSENVLLEFTATCDLENPTIRAAYLDKIVFDYPLTKFYYDGWSKEIAAFKADVELSTRELAACVLSQYRLKIFEAHRLSVKPVILFKSFRIADSQKNMTAFVEMMRTLTGARLQLLKELGNERLERVFAYFERQNISFDELASELRADFSERHCISANDEKAAAAVLNTLEAPANPYRAIFAVDKLDEGWDVLNLFDIVRLYETRQSGKKISPTTISEAQLIGRGARYYPFALDDREKYKRKFDNDLGNEMRECEVLYYHCQNDRRYINELHRALEAIGLKLEETTELHLKLREDFKREEIYREGMVLMNTRVVDGVTDFREIFARAIRKIYSYESMSGAVGEESLMRDELLTDGAVALQSRQWKLGDIASINYAIVYKALVKFPIFRFDRLKEKFSELGSTREFITSTQYLGNVSIAIRARRFDNRTLHRAAVKTLGEIADALSKAEVRYRGTDFREEPFRNVFHDKTIRVSKDAKLEPIELFPNDDWSAYENCFGTSEERAFVEYIRSNIGALRRRFAKVFVVRNERELKIYDFDEGRQFEPDFVIFLQRRADDQLQVFAEPKGRHLLEHDAWKEKFLLEIERGDLIGLPFFNRDVERMARFNEAFIRLMEADHD